MPELHIDVTVANRFISSLSKSLQALCHGCMDFDNGIEIVGYINVNIDSGSKVDYVLNEKVLKSTTNSMTFVSNSFLAKKEPQKQTRDGACSPISQPQTFATVPSRMHGAHISSQFQRAASQYSPHSQIPGSSQKRSRADDFRLAGKRHRMHNPAVDTQSFGDQNFLHSQSQLSSSSASHAYSDANFKQPQEPAFSSAVDNTRQLQISIKKEILETENQNIDTESSIDQTQESSHVQIKHDPDAAKSDNETAPTDSNDNETSENTDLKDTFLEQPSSSDTCAADESISHSESDIQLPSFEHSSEPGSTKEQVLTDEANVASTSAANLSDNEPGVATNQDPSSDAPIEYDQAAEDGSYSQSAYEDAGEGSSDAGQFEVIEIDDEDEDVQAMFGDSQTVFLKGRRHSIHSHMQGLSSTSSSNSGLPVANYTNHSHSDPTETLGMIPGNQQSPYGIQCQHCSQVLIDDFNLKSHISQCHGHLMRFACSLCGKGYQTYMGLHYHMQIHEGRTFVCTVCDRKFTRDCSLKVHIKNFHKSAKCPACFGIFKLGKEYTEHVVNCLK